MKASEIRTKTKRELIDQLSDLQREILKLKMRSKNVTSEERVLRTHQFKIFKKDIARIRTVLQELSREQA